MYVIAGSWLIASVLTLLTMVMSSTIFAMLGRSSLIQDAVATLLRELENRRSDRKPRLPRGHRRDALSVAHRIRQVLVVPIGHLRFVVEEVHLRRRIRHEEIDDALRGGRKVEAVARGSRLRLATPAAHCRTGRA
jgi:hypothetical protein